jgi:outer membrane protein assembly factor BamB
MEKPLRRAEGIIMSRGFLLRIGALTALTLGVSLVHGEDNWPRFRGPEGNGVSTSTGLPTDWSPTNNIRWKSAVPGEGFSSPIVWGQSVFVTAALERGSRRVVHCVDRSTGLIRWSSEIKCSIPEKTSAMTGHAAATPVTDGKRVVASFGNAGLVCFDMEGKRLWQRSLGDFDTELGLASSPILYRDTVILVCDHDGTRFTSFDSFLIALEVGSGETRWKTERRGLERSWSTPILAPLPDRRELIVSAQDEVRGYDPETGKLLWQSAGMTGWVAPSPVFGLGMIFAVSGKNGPVRAISPGSKGNVKPEWEVPTGGPYVCTPILKGEYLYVHDEKGILTCYEAKSGQRIYRERLEGKFTASAVAGDGKLFLPNEEGTTYVIRAGKKFEILAKNALEEYTLATPAIGGTDLFLRTEKHLFCIKSAP